MYADIKAIGERIERESEFVTRLLAEIDKVIVGQQYMIERLLIGLLADGHVLIEGASPRPSRFALSPARSTRSSSASNSHPTSCRPT